MTLPVLTVFERLRWIDGRPLLGLVEPYRRVLFQQFFDERTEDARPRYNLGLFGRAKKNWKSADLVLACLNALLSDSPGGSQVYLVANDEGQAGDDLALAKKLVKANPLLGELLQVKKNIIERRDSDGFLEILPAHDAIGAHGKTYRLLGVDEIHGHRNWDLLEALAPDPTRPDTQIWITSYASLFHRPGAPLFDLLQRAKTGTDPRMLFSWYAADYCTDPTCPGMNPEVRANPSMLSWNNPDYLAQQQRRLPAHKYRRLHLNLPGLPEGSAYQPETIMDAVDRGVAMRPPMIGIRYFGFVDMSGGSSDDAVLALAHLDAEGCAVLDMLHDQGPRPPFDPNLAVERFVGTLEEYHCTRVIGDKYAGETFKRQFEAHGVSFQVSDRSKSELYEALEPALNSNQVVLLDVPTLEQQLLGLVWRGGRIDHPAGEHDDYANAAAGSLLAALDASRRMSPQLLRRCLVAGRGKSYRREF